MTRSGPPLTRYWYSRKVFRKAAPALVTTVQLRDWEDDDDGGGVVAEVVGGDGHHSSVHPVLRPAHEANGARWLPHARA